MRKTKYENVEAYIAAAPAHTRARLKQLRAIIKKAAPAADESISYMMPFYACNGVLCYFAGYERHIGFYPTGSAIVHFKTQLVPYKTSKGTVRFPLDAPLPVALIQNIVKFRIKENRQRLSKS